MPDRSIVAATTKVCIEFQRAAAETLAPPSNVVALPVKPRTCWTSLYALSGDRWATSSHFGPQGAWSWIVETVAAEHRCNEDAIGCVESTEDQPYECDDLVTINGVPVYRIQHTAAPFENKR